MGEAVHQGAQETKAALEGLKSTSDPSSWLPMDMTKMAKDAFRGFWPSFIASTCQYMKNREQRARETPT